MSYILVIAEKPSLGRSIADALEGSANGTDPIDISCKSGNYRVTWLFGHVLSLKEPEDYDINYKQWSRAQLPIYFKDWGLKPSKGKEDRVNNIGKYLKNASMVIHAGDPDEEGQLLVDEVLRWFKYSGPVKRLDTANTTKAALQKSLRKMTDNNQWVNSGMSAYARSIADMTVGVNLSRFYTLAAEGTLLTVGRVQTPTLGLVVNRDLQIESHKQITYYTIRGNMFIDGKNVPVSFTPNEDDPRLTDGRILGKADAQNMLAEISGKTFDDVLIEKKKERESPPLPFNLVKLQTYCGKKFGYDPQAVMNITQVLKDHGAITYNRSDCQYLSTEHHKEAPEVIKYVEQNMGYKFAGANPSLKSRAFNDANITAHFAIIPTASKHDISKMSVPERNVYLAICRYYMVQFYPPARKLKTTLRKSIPGLGIISATSTEVIEKGYREIFDDPKKEEISELSKISEGSYIGVMDRSEIEEKKTKPPARYTKTSLNEDMTRISKYVEDPKIKQLLLEKDKDKKGENGSIGTTATRASIIEGLVKRGYLAESGKEIISTPKGREFIQILPDDLKKPDMTAHWWVIQEQIKAGEAPYSKLTESVLESCQNIIKTGPTHLTGTSFQKAKPAVVGKCPCCGKDVLDREKAFSCSGWRDGCKFGIWKEQVKGPFQKHIFSRGEAERILDGEGVTMKDLYSDKKKKRFKARVSLKAVQTGIGSQFEFEFV